MLKPSQKQSCGYVNRRSALWLLPSQLSFFRLLLSALGVAQGSPLVESLGGMLFALYGACVE